MENRKKVVVLGGGLSGLAAADRLSDSFDVIVLEKENYFGGLAASFFLDGKEIPRYYHHIFAHDYVTQSYLKRFGMFDSLVWKRIKMGICYDGKIKNFTEPFGLLSFDYLSLLGRVRYGIFGLYVFWLMNPSKIPDDKDAESWLKRRAGREVSDKLFYQLYGRNKFNISLDKISAKQFAFRLKEREAIGNFAYPMEGLNKMVNMFERDLKARGCWIEKGVKVEKVDLKKKVVSYGRKRVNYDIIINTIPIPEFLKLANGLPEDYKIRISSLRYCPCVCVAFGSKSFMSNHYWLNFIGERVHTLFQHSNLFDGYEYKVNWVLRYGGSGEDLSLTDEKIRKEYLSVVAKFFPDIKIIWSRVFREKYAEPVYDKDYSSYKPDYATPVAGLYMAGVQVSYPKIRNMNSALESGLKVADIIKKGYLC